MIPTLLILSEVVMFSISLRNAEHLRRYSIHALQNSGWEVSLEEDQRVTRHTHYHDWHRVERTLAVFRLEVSELTARGWQEVPS